MSFSTYPTYKDSGVEWLGEMPEHWHIKPLKFNASCNDTVLPDSTDDDYEIEYVEISDVNEISGITGSTSYKFSDAPSRARRMLQDGDVLISTVRTYLRAIAPVVTPPENLIASTGFAVVRPRKGILDGTFLGYLLRAEWWISEVIARSVGVSYPAINASDLIGLNVPVPALHEQTQIARFLDHETARIDALIEEQQRLIELLKEKRQAVISHAVTKGLDPTVPMKDSGVEWLGEVPAQWDVCSVRRVIRVIEQGWSPECEASPSDEQNWGVLKAGCVNRGVFDPSENKTLPAWLEPIAEYEVRAGDILMSRASGSPELVGSTALLGEVRERLMLSDKIFRIHLEEKVSSPFFVWVMNARFMRIQIEQALSGGNGMANNLPQSSLLAFWLAVPPSHEQDSIAEYINELTENIDALISEGGSAVELLQERRTALISAAVTGKIDVRGWQLPTRAEAPELEEVEAV